ncbi:hypothetical protein Tsp_05758, partial [Trichinella spiralis]
FKTFIVYKMKMYIRRQTERNQMEVLCDVFIGVITNLCK